MNAKILYCHPPPGISEISFNERTHELALLRSIDKKRAPVTRVGKGADTFVPSNVPVSSGDGALPVLGQGHKSQAVDRAFFTNTSNLAFRPFVQGSARNGQEYSRAKLFPHQNAVANDGSALTGGRVQIDSVSAKLGAEIDPGKKHHKKNKSMDNTGFRGINMDKKLGVLRQ